MCSHFCRVLVHVPFSSLHRALCFQRGGAYFVPPSQSFNHLNLVLLLSQTRNSWILNSPSSESILIYMYDRLHNTGLRTMTLLPRLIFFLSFWKLRLVIYVLWQFCTVLSFMQEEYINNLLIDLYVSFSAPL